MVLTHSGKTVPFRESTHTFTGAGYSVGQGKGRSGERRPEATFEVADPQTQFTMNPRVARAQEKEQYG